MPDNTANSGAAESAPTPPSKPTAEGARADGNTVAAPDTRTCNRAAGAAQEAAGREDHPPEALKQRLEETRLSPELKEAIVAELPSPEEQEREYRELMEKGGLSFEAFLELLDQEAKPQP